jgi:DNA-binding response OmpR family regulator
MRNQTVILTGRGSKLGKIVADGFERAGYSTVVATNWRLALELAASSEPALLVFDAESVDSEVWEAWHQVVDDKRIRRIPLILLAGDRPGRGHVALTRDEPFVIGSSHPHSTQIGTARPTTRTIQTGRLVMDLDRHAVTYDGTTLNLTPTEFRVLHGLASQSGRVVLRSELQRLMSGAETPTTIRVHITALRRKLGSAGAERLKTIRGVGFVWNGK